MPHASAPLAPHEQADFCPSYIADALRSELQKYRLFYGGSIKKGQEGAYSKLAADLFVRPRSRCFGRGLLEDRPLRPEEFALEAVDLVVWVPHAQFGEVAALAEAPPGCTASFFVPCPKAGCSGHGKPDGAHDHFRCAAGLQRAMFIGTWAYKCTACGGATLASH